MFSMLRNYLALDFPVYVTKASNECDGLNYYVDFTHMNLVKYFNLEFDKDGVPFKVYPLPLGKQRNYLFVVIWGIFCFQKYIRKKSESYLRETYKQVDWLIRNAHQDNVRGIFWTMEFPWIENDVLINPPSISAMGQGMALSLLVRIFKLRKERSYQQLFEDALTVFEIDIENGGVKYEKNGLVFFEEYCSIPPLQVLDGSLVALLGLHDTYKYAGSKKAKILFEKGVFTLEKTIHLWDYRNIWSWYYIGEKLSDRMYNKFNACLLSALYQITNIKKFNMFADYWSPHKKTIGQKMLIYWRWLTWRIEHLYSKNSFKKKMQWI